MYTKWKPQFGDLNVVIGGNAVIRLRCDDYTSPSWSTSIGSQCMTLAAAAPATTDNRLAASRRWLSIDGTDRRTDTRPTHIGAANGGVGTPPSNWVHKKILDCAAELNTQNCARFGSQICLITAMIFREAIPPNLCPWTPLGDFRFCLLYTSPSPRD